MIVLIWSLLRQWQKLICYPYWSCDEIIKTVNFSFTTFIYVSTVSVTLINKFLFNDFLFKNGKLTISKLEDIVLLYIDIIFESSFQKHCLEKPSRNHSLSACCKYVYGNQLCRFNKRSVIVLLWNSALPNSVKTLLNSI